MSAVIFSIALQFVEKIYGLENLNLWQRPDSFRLVLTLHIEMGKSTARIYFQKLVIRGTPY